MSFGGQTFGDDGDGSSQNINTTNINWEGTGFQNTSYDGSAANLNPQAIPGQNLNLYSDPTNAAPNLIGKNGNVTVHTASLAAFGKWVSTDLTQALNGLLGQLDSVEVQPGSFNLADDIRTKVNGTGGTTGLASQFHSVIQDLVNGLADISTGVDELVKMYENTEDLNSAQASQVESDMSNSFANATSEFNTLGAALQSSGAGGSSSSGTS